MINYLKNHYEPLTSNFLRLLLLNDKTYNYVLVKKLNQLNLIHLFVISGIHVNVLTNIIGFIFKKFRKLNYVIGQIVVMFLFYLSAFNISLLRVMIKNNIQFFKPKVDSFQANLYTGIFINVVFINEIHTYSYLLSIICSLFISFLFRIINHKIVLFLIINCFTSVVILPIINIFNQQINALAFLNNFLFSNIVLIFYLVSLFTCWIPFMFDIFNSIVKGFDYLFNHLIEIEHIFNFKLNSNLIYFIYVILINIVNGYLITKDKQEILNPKLFKKILLVK